MSEHCPQDGGFVGEAGCTHPNHHKIEDQRRRKILLPYAIATVKGGKRGRNPKGGRDSFAYARDFGNMCILVLTDSRGAVEDAFSIIPKRRGK